MTPEILAMMGVVIVLVLMAAVTVFILFLVLRDSNHPLEIVVVAVGAMIALLMFLTAGIWKILMEFIF